MVAIPTDETAIENVIDNHYQETQDRNNRPHLGASQIGQACDRALWYVFRWAMLPDFDGRMIRLFDRGNREEDIFLEQLNAVGVETADVDPRTGKQFSAALFGGHFAGSLDGFGINIPAAPKTPHVLEFKTFADKYFKQLKADGVEKSKPEHYAQMVVYMYLKNKTRALYLAVNKNDDELYSERVEANTEFAKQLIERARRVIENKQPPARINNDPTFFKCAMCDFRNHCHFEKVSAANCRTCVSSTPVIEDGGQYGTGGRWTCDYRNIDIPLDHQRQGCPQHLFIPALVPFGRVLDADQDARSIQYELIATDKTFYNRAQPGELSYPSGELQHMTAALMDDSNIDLLRNVFDATIEEVIAPKSPFCDFCKDAGEVETERGSAVCPACQGIPF